MARDLYETNIWGLLAVTQIVSPHMIKRRSGTIVNIGSVLGIRAAPWLGNIYCIISRAYGLILS